MNLTADGVNVESVLNTTPLLRSHRISATYPAPTSNTLPEASGPLGCVTAATNGATKSGYTSLSCQLCERTGVWETYLEVGKHLRWHNGLCHSRCSHGSDHNSMDAILGTLSSKRLGIRDQTHLRSAVVRLPKVSYSHKVKVNNRPLDTTQYWDEPYKPAALAVFTTLPNFCFLKIGHAALVHENAPLRWTSWTWSHSASDMFLNLPQGLHISSTRGQNSKHIPFIPQNPRIVNQYRHTAESIHSGFDNSRSVNHARSVDHCFSTS